MSATSAGQRPGGPSWETLADAARFWEPRRVVYNLVLAAVAIIWIGATWPHFRDAATPSHILALAVLALLANLAYCGAYLADIAIRQVAPLDPYRLRIGVLLVGLAFGLLVENYWIADEIYPAVH